MGSLSGAVARAVFKVKVGMGMTDVKKSKLPGFALRSVYIVTASISLGVAYLKSNFNHTATDASETEEISVSFKPTAWCYDGEADAIRFRQECFTDMTGVGKSLIYSLVVVGLYIGLRVWCRLRHNATSSAQPFFEHFEPRCEYAYDFFFFVGAAISVGLAIKDHDELATTWYSFFVAEAQEHFPPGVITDYSYSYEPGFYLLCVSLVASGIMVFIGVKEGPWHDYHPAHSWVPWNQSDSSSEDAAKEGVELVTRSGKAGIDEVKVDELLF
jgi:hypothetical protein